MPSINERISAKLARAFTKLAQPCQFIPSDGEPAFSRSVNLPPTEKDRSNEYVLEPVSLAEFLLSEGKVQCDDLFELNGNQYRLTQHYGSDDISVSFVYVSY
ncbi:hypothetical protein [Shewanella holmiensis]|uniref:Uncharacterized protein n=1 Tax=Shewanella holmiensis TaxID=2952222 RepID=A0A9X2WNF0_9GAMM|nr:hypothetical protein [Shewanella holmiensis]MCT7942385.1 hypothetical protein [Shewanella holmiensis]